MIFYINLIDNKTNTTKVRIEEIFELIISQKEGELAAAQMKISCECYAEYFRDSQISFAEIIAENEGVPTVIFRGKLTTFPAAVSNFLITIQIIAEVKDFHQQMQQISDEFRDSSDYDHLFGKNNEITEVNPVYLYFDKVTGNVSLSSIIDDVPKHELGQNDHWRDLTQVHVTKSQISRLDVSVEAQWLQESSGTVDIFPAIINSFQENQINSLTDLKKQWWKISESLPKKSPYSVVHSHLEEVPNGIMPTAKVLVNNKELNLKRFWFIGTLMLAWDYKQKREEVASFSIVNPKALSDKVKKISFQLRPLQQTNWVKYWQPKYQYKKYEQVEWNNQIFQCIENHISDSDFNKNYWSLDSQLKSDAIPADAGSFFATERGKEALVNAGMRALNHIIAAERNIEVNICGHFDNLCNITVNDTMKLNDSRFPGGYICGKVVKIVSRITSGKRTTTITIACSSSGNLAFNQEVWRKRLQQYFFQFQIDFNKLEITADKIVEKVVIDNPPEYQMEVLRNADIDNMQQLKRYLSEIATVLKIKLFPLNTYKTLKKHLQLADVIFE